MTVDTVAARCTPVSVCCTHPPLSLSVSVRLGLSVSVQVSLRVFCLCLCLSVSLFLLLMLLRDMLLDSIFHILKEMNISIIYLFLNVSNYVVTNFILDFCPV